MSWEGNTPHAKGMRISIENWQAFQQFLVLERGFSDKQKGLEIYHRRFKRLVAWFDGKDFTRKGFVEFLGDLHARGLKNSYLNNFVKDAKLIDRFLGTSELKDYRVLRERKSIPKDPLSAEEIKRLADVYISYRRDEAFTNARQRAIIMLIGTTGCRINEALGLKLSDIHDTPAHVVFRDTKNGEDRTVPVSTEILDLLLKLPRRSENIFTVTEQTVNSDLKVRAKECGILKRVYAHLFRESYITEMINQGVDWFVLSKIVGHKDPATTMGYYNQSLKEASRIVMMHPLLRPTITYEQQIEMLRNEVNKHVNTKSANLAIEENAKEIVIRLSRIMN